jgi:hypothetical protein
MLAELAALDELVGGGGTHTAPSKYHDEIVSLAFIHTKYGEPIVIMGFRCTIQKVLCLTPPELVSRRPPRAAPPRSHAEMLARARRPPRLRRRRQSLPACCRGRVPQPRRSPSWRNPRPNGGGLKTT